MDVLLCGDILGYTLESSKTKTSKRKDIKGAHTSSCAEAWMPFFKKFGWLLENLKTYSGPVLSSPRVL